MSEPPPPRTLPLVLVRKGADKETTRYEMGEEALEFLSTLPPNLAILSAAGDFRTGKSFLLNRGVLRR